MGKSGWGSKVRHNNTHSSMQPIQGGKVAFPPLFLCFAGFGKAIFYYAFFVKRIIFENICIHSIHYVVRVQHQASSSVSRARGHHLTYRRFEPHSHPTFFSLLFSRGIGFCCLPNPLVRNKVWLLLPVRWQAWR